MSTLYGGANAFPGLLVIPADGDPRDALSVNAAFEGLADRTTYLHKLALREASVARVSHTQSSDTVPDLVEQFTTASYVNGSSLFVDVAGGLVNDRLVITLWGSFGTSDGATSGAFRIYVIENSTGTPVTQTLDYSKYIVQLGSTAAGVALPYCIAVNWQLTAAGTTRVGVQGIRTAGAGSVKLFGAHQLQVLTLRQDVTP